MAASPQGKHLEEEEEEEGFTGLEGLKTSVIAKNKQEVSNAVKL